MSTRNNDESVAEDTKRGEESSSASEQHSRLLRENPAVADALAAQLSTNAALRLNPMQPLSLETLQLLMQGRGTNPNLSGLHNNPGAAHFPMPALQAQTALREARIRTLLRQQQEQQLLQHILLQQRFQQQNIRQVQPQQSQQVENYNLLADITGTRTGGAQLPRSSLPQSLAGFQQASTNVNSPNWQNYGLSSNASALSPSVGQESRSLPSLLTAGAVSSPNSNQSSHLSGQVISAQASSRDSSSPQGVARLPEAQSQAQQEERPEMKDAEYFELFGFNDEDGVQIINETFPHKLYRMLFEVEKKGLESIVSFFPHGKGRSDVPHCVPPSMRPLQSTHSLSQPCENHQRRSCQSTFLLPE